MSAIFLASVLAVISAGECHAQFSRLSIGDYGISSIRSLSFSSVGGAVWIDVTNPAEGFTLSEISGMVYKKGKPFVRGEADDVYIASGKGRREINGRASLCEGVSLWTVLGLLVFDPDDYTVDLRMTVMSDTGKQRRIDAKGMPVSELLKIK